MLIHVHGCIVGVCTHGYIPQQCTGKYSHRNISGIMSMGREGRSEATKHRKREMRELGVLVVVDEGKAGGGRQEGARLWAVGRSLQPTTLPPYPPFLLSCLFSPGAQVRISRSIAIDNIVAHDCYSNTFGWVPLQCTC